MLRVDEIKEEKNEMLVKQEDPPPSATFISRPGPSGESRPAWLPSIKMRRIGPQRTTKAEFIQNFFDTQKKAVESRLKESGLPLKRHYDESEMMVPIEDRKPIITPDPGIQTVESFFEARKKMSAERKQKETESGVSLKRHHDESKMMNPIEDRKPIITADPGIQTVESFFEARKRRKKERKLLSASNKELEHVACQTDSHHGLEWEHFGRTMLELNLDMFPKSQEINIENNGHTILENIFNNLKILRKEIDPTGRRTMFGGPCKLLMRMTGVSSPYVHSIGRRVPDLEMKKPTWKELDSAGAYRRLISEIPVEYVDAIKEYVESSWANDHAPTIKDCCEWTLENHNVDVSPAKMAQILRVLKLRSTDKPLPESCLPQKEDAGLLYLREIEKARHENCYISYFSAQKFGETTIFSQFVDTGILEKSIEITETENFYENLDDYMSRQIPMLAKEAKKLGRKAVIVVDRQYQLVFEKMLPCTKSRRFELIKFMKDNGQPYVDENVRTKIYETVDEFIEKLGGRTRIYKRELEKVAKEENVQVIRLPRTEYVLNPMELIFGELLSHITDETEDEIRKAVQNWEANIDEKMTEVCYEDIFEKEMAMRKKLENDYKEEDEDF